MKEIMRWLQKDGKEFVSFNCDNGIIYLNYSEGRKLHTCMINDNSVLNVRTINVINTYLNKILNSL